MHLQIYIGDEWQQEAETPCPWVLRDARGQKAREGRSRLADLPAAANISVMLAASCALITSLRLPTRQIDKMRRLAPYALEEQAMADPEHIHVALGGFQDDGAVQVAAIDRGWLGRLLECLRVAGIKPQRMQIETLNAHHREHEWAVVLKEDGGFVRTGAQTGAALDLAADGRVPLGLQLALEDAGEQRPHSIVVHYQPGLELPDLAHWAGQLGVPVTRGLPWDWSEPHQPAALNLLQGEFNPQARLANGWQKLRMPCLLLVLMAVIHGSLSAVDWWRLSRLQKQLTQQMDRDFRQAFPEARVVVDAPLQFTRNLEGLRSATGKLSPDDFLPLLAKAAPVLSAGNNGRVTQLRYEHQTLTVDLALPPGQSAQAVQAHLAGAGLKVEKADIKTQPAGIIVHFLLKA